MRLGLVSARDWWSPLSTLTLDGLSLAQQIVMVLAVLVSGLLAVYALNVWALVLRAIRRKKPTAVSVLNSWPLVSVHVPVYNEKTIVLRLLDSILAFDYPREKLDVVIIDDSNDETSELVESYRQRHPNLVTVIHRENREGFKAGALQAGLTSSKGSFVAVFDADHVPPRDFLRRLVPYLYNDNWVAFAQARAGYLNRARSWVGRALTLGIDSYAFVDQEARHSGNLLTHFSGSGAVFRTSALLDVGGWNSETLAEDLDLSIRLRLRGWRFVYDSGVLCPGEIPTSFAVLRQQQFRWASGFAGCLKKHLRELIETGELSLLQKTEALIYLTSYAASPLIALGVVTAVLYCLVFPLDFVLHGFRSNALAAFTVFCSALIYTAPFALFTLAVVRSSKGLADRTKRSVDLAYLGVLSVAIFLTSSKAILQGLLNKATYFYRTPKHESARTGA